jgi:hypothetical protein
LSPSFFLKDEKDLSPLKILNKNLNIGQENNEFVPTSLYKFKTLNRIYGHENRKFYSPYIEFSPNRF